MFEWDKKKELQNIAKHKYSFEFAKAVFFDPKRLIIEDLEHSSSENRFYCIGKIDNEILTVRFTYRNGKIRIIGAGNWRKERKLYESKTKERQK